MWMSMTSCVCSAAVTNPFVGSVSFVISCGAPHVSAVGAWLFVRFISLFLSAEPLCITITCEGFTETGDTPFGPLRRFPELQEGVHAFGICARVEVRLLRDLAPSALPLFLPIFADDGNVPL